MYKNQIFFTAAAEECLTTRRSPGFTKLTLLFCSCTAACFRQGVCLENFMPPCWMFLLFTSSDWLHRKWVFVLMNPCIISVAIHLTILLKEFFFFALTVIFYFHYIACLQHVSLLQPCISWWLEDFSINDDVIQVHIENGTDSTLMEAIMKA